MSSQPRKAGSQGSRASQSAPNVPGAPPARRKTASGRSHAGAPPRRIVLGSVAPVGFADFADPGWLACLRRMGCEVVQAYRNEQANVSAERVREYVAAAGLPCDSLHGVFGESYDPSAPDETARRAAVDTYKAEGELALAIGGPLVVVHCSSIREKPIPAAERARRVEQLRRSIRDLGEFGRDTGVRYAFENLPAYHPVGSDTAELVTILEDVGAPATGLCFDTGHANMVGDPVAAIRATRGQMIYVHFCDNSGRGDEHLMPGLGTLDLDAVALALREMDYRGTVMLELFYSTAELCRMLDEGAADRLERFLAIANGERAPAATGTPPRKPPA